MDGGDWLAVVHGVAELDMTEWLTLTNWLPELKKKDLEHPMTPSSIVSHMARLTWTWQWEFGCWQPRIDSWRRWGQNKSCDKIYSTTRICPSGQGYGFSCGHVWMWELDCEEGWAPKNWCFELWCWRIQAVHSEGDQPWVFLEGMMLKLKLQYFGHLMSRTILSDWTELKWK